MADSRKKRDHAVKIKRQTRQKVFALPVSVLQPLYRLLYDLPTYGYGYSRMTMTMTMTMSIPISISISMVMSLSLSTLDE